MSSTNVRTEFASQLTANFPSEKVVDLSGQFSYLNDLLTAEGVGSEDPWLGISFQGGSEDPITVNAGPDRGKYREHGLAYFHIVDVAKAGAVDNMNTRADALRTYFRGRNMNGVIVLSVTPQNFDAGATLDFDDGWMSCSFMVEYQYDINL